MTPYERIMGFFTTLINGICFYCTRCKRARTGVVTDSNGCHSDTSNQLYVVVTGIPASIAGVAFLNINPNPATDKITISSRHMPENIAITVYDLTGRIMVDEKPLLPGSNDLDISGWAKGLYMIRAKSNQQTVFQNFIKR